MNIWLQKMFPTPSSDLFHPTSKFTLFTTELKEDVTLVNPCVKGCSPLGLWAISHYREESCRPGLGTQPLAYIRSGFVRG